MLTLQLLFTYLPAMNRFFHSAPLPASAWLGILGFGVGAWVLVALEKQIRRSIGSRAPRPPVGP